MKKYLISFVTFVLLTSLNARAQDIAQLVASSSSDANKYLTSFLDPLVKGEIVNMGRGWSSSARVHKILGFDITINGQLAIVPDDQRRFIFKNSDYETIKIADKPEDLSASTTLQTFLGDKTSQPLRVYATVKDNGASDIKVRYPFSSPTGIGEDIKNLVNVTAVPLPIAQVGIGLIKNTEVKFRYFPKTNSNGVNLGIFGLAVQHEFGKDIPVISRIPFLHLSALIGYNSIEANYNLDNNRASGNSVINGANQNLDIKLSALTFQALASVKFALLEAYTTIGYSTGKANINLNGTYSVDYTRDDNSIKTISYTDPIALSFNTSSLSNTWGVRLNLLFLKVFADYTFAKYNGVGAGVSFSIR